MGGVEHRLQRGAGTGGESAQRRVQPGPGDPDLVGGSAGIRERGGRGQLQAGETADPALPERPVLRRAERLPLKRDEVGVPGLRRRGDGTVGVLTDAVVVRADLLDDRMVAPAVQDGVTLRVCEGPGALAGPVHVVPQQGARSRSNGSRCSAVRNFAIAARCSAGASPRRSVNPTSASACRCTSWSGAEKPESRKAVRRISCRSTSRRIDSRNAGRENGPSSVKWKLLTFW